VGQVVFVDRLHVQQLGIRSLGVAAAAVVVAAAVLAQCQHLQAEREQAAPPVVRWSPHHRYTKETSASISYDRPLEKKGYVLQVLE
jgi:hypothetical protein